ncbi:MAG: phage major capsid protein [Candidatus Methanomethylophilaceae archaeon]
MTDNTTLNEIHKLNEELKKGLNDYKMYSESYKTMKSQVDDISKKLDDSIKGYDDDIVALKKSVSMAPASGAGSISPEMKAMIEFAIEGKTATVATPSSGGYVVPNEFISRVIPKLRDIDNIRANAETIPVSGMVADVPYEVSEGESSWVGETEDRSGVKGEGTIGLAHIPVNELVSRLSISNRLMQSNLIEMDTYLTNALISKMNRDTEKAFATGDGFNKPSGVFNDTNITQVASGAASALTINGLISLVSSLTDSASMDGRIYGSRSTLGEIAKLRDDKNPIWQPSLGNGLPPTVLGYSYMFCPSAPGATTAGNIPLVFGNMFSAYKIVQGNSMTMTRDTLTGVSKGLTYIYFSSNVGGQVVMPSSLVAQKIAAS